MLEAVQDGQGGRRVLIVISSGWPSGPDGSPVQRLASLANSLAVPIVTIDPQQFVGGKQSIARVPSDVAELRATTTASLRALSVRTNGVALLDSPNITEAVGRARLVIRP
jgi:hypothetical protein